MTELAERNAARGRLGRGPLLFLLSLYAAHIALIVAYGHARPQRMRIAGIDPVAYYSYFHSLWFDHDLSFQNQFDLLGGGFMPDNKTPKGLAANHSSIGPALALAPFWIAADGIARLGGWPADGASAPYHMAGFIGLAVYGLAALLLMGLFCARQFGSWPGAWAAATAWGAGPLLYYSFPITVMPHAIGTALAALFLLACMPSQASAKRAGLIAGLAMGLAMLGRWQNLLFAAYPAALSIERLLSSQGRKEALRREAGYWLLFALGAILAFSPQMIAWQLLFGTFLTRPQGEGYLLFSRPEIVKMLFSTHNGLFAWTPAMAVGAAGLLFVRRPLRAAAAGLGAALLLQTYLNSICLDWHGAWGFSIRRFTESAPIFAFGFGALAVRFAWRNWRRILAAAASLAILWNELFVFQYTMHLVSWDQPLTAHEMLGDKLHLRTSWARKWLIDSAVLNFKEGDIESAFQILQDAYIIDPKHDDIAIAFGQMHYALGDYNAAALNFITALELRPGQGRVERYLEQTYEAARLSAIGQKPPPLQ
ncbi:MAG: hypothetical protein BWZ10_00068 [candidate division BRC1 bacterium ADurb.BinA364]|nr:MAG: hypothetical protein BWZ10_00068 [candidate division BRC1 bacterium ADurb.BinA364]